jgi:WXG100 family type VII secretion target
MSMNPGDIFVNYSGVQNVVDVLQTSTQAVGRILDDINTIIQPMMARWQGSSVQAYSQVQRTWNQRTTDMQNVLSQYGPVLDEMSGNYSTTDNNLALQWSGIG